MLWFPTFTNSLVPWLINNLKPYKWFTDKAQCLISLYIIALLSNLLDILNKTLELSSYNILVNENNMTNYYTWFICHRPVSSLIHSTLTVLIPFTLPLPSSRNSWVIILKTRGSEPKRTLTYKDFFCLNLCKYDSFQTNLFMTIIYPEDPGPLRPWVIIRPFWSGLRQNFKRSNGGSTLPKKRQKESDRFLTPTIRPLP